MHEPSRTAPVVRPHLRFGVVILAAGGSSRMGTPKQLLPINGRGLVVRAADAALAAGATPVVVVIGASADRIRPSLQDLPVLIAENPDWPEGMASSIRAGMAALDPFTPRLDAVMIALCDQPAFSSQVIRQIVTAQSASSRSIVAARYAGRNGAPALFLRAHFAELAALTGDHGARALLGADPARVDSVDLPQLGIDVDTPADYAALNAF